MYWTRELDSGTALPSSLSTPSSPRSSIVRTLGVSALLAGLLLFAVAPQAAAQDCSEVGPWINEFDYDSQDGGINNDRDEFIEIGAPAGTDLGGIRVLAVEGNSGFLSLPCLSGLGVSTGNKYFDLAIPPGTIVPDDTGTGVGFVVICLGTTSNDIQSLGFCDVILPTQFNDSSLKNGSLTAPAGNCPDGVLLLNADNSLVDAVSYEGGGPVGNSGSYGSYFNPPNTNYFLPHTGPYDNGFPINNSLALVTQEPGRGDEVADWVLSPEFGHTPGWINPGQDLSCGPPPDADLDGVPDAEDNCIDDPNPLQEDADLDGVGDACDNCPDDPNPGQEDADLDGEGDACECDPNPGNGSWEITYDLGNGTYVDIRDTPLGAGDQWNLVGPGTMTVRYEADGLGDILDGGAIDVVHADLVQAFTVSTNILGFVANVVTDLDSDLPDDRWNGNPSGFVDPGSAQGTITGSSAAFSTLLMDWHTFGTISCTGNACSQGGLPGDGTPVPQDNTQDLSLSTFTYSGGGAFPGAVFDSNEMQTLADPNANTFLGLHGEELSRVFVPGSPAEICDPDGDGFPDSEDNCPAIPNDQADANSDGIGDACQPDDADGDGWPDAEDNCPADANTDQADINGDGEGDVCQSGDTDGDGWPDAEDNCPAIANSSQDNLDGDLHGDVCDNCDAVANNDQSDLNGDGIGDVCQPNDPDGDGWPDIDDNCDGTPNPLQEDGDADGVGDACDACPTDPANDVDSDGLCADEDPCPVDPGNDADNDGFCAEVDNCPTTTNPNQTDADLDGIGNVCDANSETTVLPALSPLATGLLALALALSGAGVGRVGRRTRRVRGTQDPH